MGERDVRAELHRGACSWVSLVAKGPNKPKTLNTKTHEIPASGFLGLGSEPLAFGCSWLLINYKP